MPGSPSKRQLLRMLERDREQFFAIIREQNDRIMQLAGQPWNLPPRPKVERTPAPEPVEDHGELLEL